MSLDPVQFADLIGRVLRVNERKPGGLYSEAAVRLLLGTAAQESAFGTYIRQKGGGPALGMFQMEPATFDDLRDRLGDKYPAMKGRVAAELEWDLSLAILVARLKYKADPAPLPAADDLPGLAAYYKRVYNSPLGAATVEQFAANAKRYGVFA